MVYVMSELYNYIYKFTASMNDAASGDGAADCFIFLPTFFV